MRVPLLRVISLGAGVQSTTMALMADRGLFGPVPDCAIFADTGWEPKAVYEHLTWLESALSYPVHHVSSGNLRTDVLAGKNTDGKRFSAVPWYVISADGSKGIGRRQCTAEYKLKPIMHKLRDLLGVGRRTRIAKGAVEILIGISTDEAIRMKPPRQKWQKAIWPLLDEGMSRHDCAVWLWDEYERIAPRSACGGCPFLDKEQRRNQKINAPEEFADAVFVDHAIRYLPANGSIQFMHNSRMPLDEVDFDLIELDVRQGSLFNNECEGMCGV